MVEGLVVDAEGVQQSGCRRPRALPGVQREGRVGIRRLQPLHHVLDADAEPLGDLTRRRGATQRLRQVAGHRADRHPQLLQPARTRIAQPLSRKWRLISPMIVGVAYVENSTPPLGVEAVDGLDQPDRADLDEVVERLTAVGEPAGAVVDQRQVQLHQLARGTSRGAPRGSPVASSAKSAWLRSRVTARAPTEAPGGARC